MMKLIKIIFVIVLFIFLLSVPVKADSGHLVISEVQVSGISANDEFVELYNSTDSPIDINGYRLSKETSGGTISNLITTMTGIVPAHGYFLVTPVSGFSGAVSNDLAYSTSSFVTDNNTIILYSDAGHTVIDKVGFGTAINFESAVFPTTPPLGQSIERILNRDTDNNSLDFQIREFPNPHNSGFIETTNSPSPTPSPTQSPTASPNNDPTPKPSGVCTYKILSDVHEDGVSPQLGFGLGGNKYTGWINFSITDTQGLKHLLFEFNQPLDSSITWNQFYLSPPNWTENCNVGDYYSCVSHDEQSEEPPYNVTEEPFTLQYAYYDVPSWVFVNKYLYQNTQDLKITANGTDICNIVATPTPNDSPSPSPSPAPTSSPTLVPTQTPTQSPIPTDSPTPTPPSSPSPSSTVDPTPTVSPTTSPTPISAVKPPGWLKSPVFTCQNLHIPDFVYSMLKLLMPQKFSCN